MVRIVLQTSWDYSQSTHTGTVVADIAKCRAEIEGARLLVLSAAVQVWMGGYRTNCAVLIRYRLTSTKPRVR